MKLIKLSKNKQAIVDDEDFEKLNNRKWSVCKSRDGRNYYARRRAIRGFGTQKIMMHREILGLLAGDIRVTDHINGNGLDNRKSNIRICSILQNSWNQMSPRIRKTSKYKGVFYYNKIKKYRSHIRNNGEKLFIGDFESELDAARQYNVFAMNLYGEFAKQNKITETEPYMGFEYWG